MNSPPAEEEKEGGSDYKQFVVSEEIAPKVGQIWQSKVGYSWHTKKVLDTVKIIEVDVNKIQFVNYIGTLSVYRDDRYEGDLPYPTSIYGNDQKKTMDLSKFTEDYFPYVKD